MPPKDLKSKILNHNLKRDRGVEKRTLSIRCPDSRPLKTYFDLPFPVFPLIPRAALEARAALNPQSAFCIRANAPWVFWGGGFLLFLLYDFIHLFIITIFLLISVSGSLIDLISYGSLMPLSSSPTFGPLLRIKRPPSFTIWDAFFINSFIL